MTADDTVKGGVLARDNKPLSLLAAAAEAGDPLARREDPAREQSAEADDEWLAKHDPEPGNDEDEGWVADDAPSEDEPVAEEQPEAEHTADGDTDDGDDGEHTPEVDDAEFQRARSALGRDGVPEKVLAAMSPEEVLTWGLKRAKVHQDTDRVYGELKSIKTQQTVRPAEESPGDSEHTEATPRIDLSTALKPLADELALEGDAAKALTAGFEQALELATKPLLERITRQEQVIQRVTTGQAEAAMTKARQQLGERFPGVNDQERWDAVLQRADGYAKSGSYQDALTCLTDACKVEFFDTPPPAANGQTKETRSKRTRSQPTSTTRREAPARSKTAQEREDAYLRAYDETGNPAKAREAYHG